MKLYGYGLYSIAIKSNSMYCLYLYFIEQHIQDLMDHNFNIS